MNSFKLFESFDLSVCVPLTLTLAHFLWQGTLVAILTWVASVLLGRRSSQVRYAVFVAAFFLMAACPVITFISLNNDSPIQPAIDQPVVAMSPLPVVASKTPVPIIGEHSVSVSTNAESDLPIAPVMADLNWRDITPHATLLYLVGVTMMLCRLMVGLYGGQRLRRGSQPVDQSEVLSSLARQAKALELSFTPAIAYCRDVTLPTVVGVLRPMILLPISLASGLSTQQLEVLLAHELAHIRRYDHLVNIAQRIIEALLFFHPAVWYVSHLIRTERENCCDDLVVSLGGKATAYAASLVQIAELSLRGGTSRHRAATAAIGVADRPSQLRSRILRLLGSPKNRQIRLTRSWGLIACIAALACFTIFGTIRLQAKSKDDMPPPATQGQKDVSKELRQQSAGKLRMLSGALHEYKIDHQGRFPDSLRDAELEGFAKHLKYLGRGKTTRDSRDTVIAYDDKLLQEAAGTYILFSDGYVGFFDSERLKDFLRGPLPGTTEKIDTIMLRLVGPDGKPVVGAKVGTGLGTGNRILMGLLPLRVHGTKEQVRSNEHGEVVLPGSRLFDPRWPAERKRSLYAFHEGKQLAGLFEISRDLIGSTTNLTLQPACHVHGRLTSSVLNGMDLPLRTSMLYIKYEGFVMNWVGGSYTEDKHRFEFLLPPGSYEFFAYGSGGKGQSAIAGTKDVRRTGQIKPGQAQLDLGVIDLPPTKWAAMLGSLAPELQMKAWKHGGPVTLADLLGKVVLLHFGGTTSRDLPRLVRLHEDLKDHGLVVIGIYTSNAIKGLEARFPGVSSKYGGVRDVPFLLGIDVDDPASVDKKSLGGATAAAYGITGWPSTLLIDQNGKLVGRFIVDSGEQGLERMLGFNIKTKLPALSVKEIKRLYGEDSSTTSKVAVSPGFSATLPNGVTVELVGVCEYPSEGKQWWGPEGSLLDEKIHIKGEAGIRVRGRAVQLVMKVDGPEEMSVTYSIKGALDQGLAGGLVVDHQGKQIKGMRVVTADTDSDDNATDLTIATAVGPWQTNVKIIHGKAVWINTMRDRNILFSQAYEDKNGINVTVSHDQGDLDFRVIAIDDNDKLHVTRRIHSTSNSWLHSTPNKQIQLSTAHFDDLKLKQVKGFQFQTRPYQWVTFKNVSLRPGKKTDMRIDVKSDKAEAKVVDTQPVISVVQRGTEQQHSDNSTTIAIEARFLRGYHSYESDSGKLFVGTERLLQRLLKEDGIELQARSNAQPGDLSRPVKVGVLSNQQAMELLGLYQANEFSSVVNAPRLLIRDGQDGSLSTGRDEIFQLPNADDADSMVTGTHFVGTTLQVRPAIDADQEHITLKINAAVTELMQGKPFEKTAEASLTETISNGQTLLIRIPFVQNKLIAIREKIDPKTGKTVQEIVKEPIDQAPELEGYSYVLIKPGITKPREHTTKSSTESSEKPSSPGVIECRVIDAAGQPIPNAWIRWFMEEDKFSLNGGPDGVRWLYGHANTTLTNSNGEFIITRFGSEKHGIYIKADSFAQYMVVNLVLPRDAGKLREIVLEDGCKVFGTVLEEGKPVPYARVGCGIFSKQFRDFFSSPYPSLYTTTDEKGYYEFLDLPAGPQSVSVNSSLAKGNQNIAGKTINLRSGYAVELNFGDEVGFALTGWVTERDTPLPNARVTIWRSDKSLTKYASTDSDGWFRITRLPSGSYTALTRWRTPQTELSGSGQQNWLFDMQDIIINKDISIDIDLADYPANKKRRQTTKPAIGPIGSTLEFRIVPALSPYRPDEFARYEKDLGENGPMAGRGRSDQFQWFEIEGQVRGNSIRKQHQGRWYVLLCARADLVMLSEKTGPNAWGLRRVYGEKDANGRPAVRFEFDDKGAKLLSRLTKAKVGKALAVLVDDKVIATPTLQSPLSRHAIITGSFTQEDVDKLVEALKIGMPATTRPSSRKATQSPEFGPVIERVVNDDPSGENCLIDFDTSKLFSMPKEVLGSTEKALAWCEKNGIDAGGGTQGTIRGLICYDMIIFPRENDIWDRLRPASLASDKDNAFKFSKPGSPVSMSAKGGVPATFTFKTREGGVGVLQILEVNNTAKPKHIKIRYKMVRGVSSQAVTRQPAKATSRNERL